MILLGKVEISQDPVSGSTYFPNSSALPVVFKRELQNQELQEGESVTLRCELSKPGVPVVWRKGTEVISSGEKAVHQLRILRVEEGDAGLYTCKTKDAESCATLTVKGKRVCWPVTFLFSFYQLD
uniref:Ig-like domain-containing protein n=1 Tax=Sinocyclocheilus grahami TaxID=75366 RepID=A0A672LDL9_SINGR